MRPCALILLFPPFSAVSAVILCRSGNPTRKPALKNQNEIFQKPSPGGVLVTAIHAGLRSYIACRSFFSSVISTVPRASFTIPSL